MGSIFQNYQVRVSIKFLLLSCLITLLVGMVSIDIIDGIYKEQILRQEEMLIGEIKSINPELVGEVASIITRGEYSEEIAKDGRDILNTYGYDKNTLYKLEDINKKVWGTLAVTLVVFMLIMIGNEYKSYEIFYNQVSNMNEKLDLIIAGDYRVKVKDGLEGEFYKLSRNINRLVEIVYGSISSLYKEKVFLKDMISDISHQLKTPLSTLSIYNQLLSQKMLDEEAEKDILSNSAIVLEKMEWLIINLLKIAKFEVSAVEFKRKDIDIKELIELSIYKLKGKATEKNIQIEVIGKNDIVNLDLEWTEEAFINIIKNAIEHSHKDGKIEIEIESNLAETKVYIKDFGEGISEEDKPHIFKRFYKGKSSKKDSVGIGLAMAKTIFEKQGGNIIVNADKDATVFIIDFVKI